MGNTLTIDGSKSNTKSILLDLIALAVVYFVPTLTHLLNLPLYLFEPIRIMLILSIVHTKKVNAFALALSLPLFSFAVAGHPVFFKMLIISAEMALNVWLFYVISKEIKSTFLAMVLSIALSKLVYYAIQYIFIVTSLLTWQEVEHPILPQVIVVFALSGYVYFAEKFKKAK